MGSDAVSMVVALVVFVLLFLILRAVVLWYWRVNEIVAELKSLNSNVALLVSKQGPITPEVKQANFEAWLENQNRRAADLSSDELAEMRQAYEFKRKLGEI